MRLTKCEGFLNTYTTDRINIQNIQRPFKKVKETNTLIKNWARDLNREFTIEEIETSKKYVKKCLWYLAIWKIPIKTLRFHLISWDGEDQQNNWQMMVVVEREEATFTVGGRANCCHHSGNLEIWRFLKKLKINPVILLPHIFLRDSAPHRFWLSRINCGFLHNI